MNLTVDFVSVMSILRLDMKQKAGNYACPFCTKKSFTIYPENQMGYCHTCKWSGDALKLYCEWKRVSRDEACRELGVSLKDGFLQLKEKLSDSKEQTYAEAKSEFAKDLEFLAWVRMYEGFYPDPEKRFNRKIFENKTGLKKAALSKIINGKLGNALTWRKVLAVLRSDLEGPIKELKRKVALGAKYFEDLTDEEKRGKDVEKYRIKKRKRPRPKKADE